MTKVRLALLVILGAVGAAYAAAEPPRVSVETSMGSFVLELYPDRAPKTVESFLARVEEGFYENTLVHRVVAGFMIQGGGIGKDLRLKPPGPRLANEADNGLRNERGAVAMAREPDPHSATVQFFVNLVDNTHLDHRDKTPRGWGYAVFGRVVEGMDVVDAIAAVPVRRTRISEAQPLEPVVILKAERRGAGAAEEVDR